MATVRLSDVIVPEVFGAYMTSDSVVKTELMDSVAVGANASIAAQLSGGGYHATVPSWNDLADDGSEVPTDNPLDLPTPSKIGTFRMVVRKQFRTKTFAAMDIASDLATGDPKAALTRITSRVTSWWGRDHQKMLLDTLNGILADNTANDNSDMTLDRAIPVGAGPTDVTVDNLMSPEVFLNATGYLGDHRDRFSVIIMHSTVCLGLEKQNVVKTVCVESGSAPSGTDPGVVNRKYYGKVPIIEDDNVTIEVTPNPGKTPATRVRYHSYMLGDGVISFGNVGGEEQAAEPWREPLAGKGSAQETLITRRNFYLHPDGFSFTDAAVANPISPTNAELASAVNWNRVAPDRKLVKIQRIITNG